MSTESSKAMAIYLLELQLAAVEAQLNMLDHGVYKDSAERFRQFSKTSFDHAQAFLSLVWARPAAEANPYRECFETVGKTFASNMQTWMSNTQRCLEINPYREVLESLASILRDAIHRAGKTKSERGPKVVETTPA